MQKRDNSGGRRNGEVGYPRLLTDSPVTSVVGTLDLTYGIAPAEIRRATRVEGVVAGLLGKAIAGKPNTVVKGYFIGAFAWFSIPLGLCVTMSYVAVALANTEYWPVSGGVTSCQINNALILPLAA
ncbi:hypothetical protein LTR65_009131 [Meristemomyces frigidus]